MGKSLVIVESPAKAKTINKYLGKDFVVKSSIGHIRDLPTSGGNGKSSTTPAERAKLAAAAKKLPPDERERRKRERAREALIKRMGIDPEHGWNPQYEILPGKDKVVEELRKLAKGADTVYLATDFDREGEAIAWHLREAIGGDDSAFKRVVFNEITKKAIEQAFAQPTDLNRDQINAQQTRAALPRPRGRLHGVAAAVGEDRPRPVRRPGAVSGRQTGGRTGTGDQRLHTRGVLGSTQRLEPPGR